MCVVSRRCGGVWGPKEALILTVLGTKGAEDDTRQWDDADDNEENRHLGK